MRHRRTDGWSSTALPASRPRSTSAPTRCATPSATGSASSTAIFRPGSPPADRCPASPVRQGVPRLVHAALNPFRHANRCDAPPTLLGDRLGKLDALAAQAIDDAIQVVAHEI